MHIGYTHHAWVLTSGLSLLRSGYKELYYSGDIPPGLKITEGVHFGHILLPLTLGYKKGLNDRWSLTPAIGAAASYNFSFIGDKYQYNEYKRTSAWAVANVVAGYKVNKHTTLTAGPEAQYMLTSLWGNTSINRKNTQNNYTILLNAGIIYTR
jgi:hypothetical protein